jgi:hypothetical protein
VIAQRTRPFGVPARVRALLSGLALCAMVASVALAATKVAGGVADGDDTKSLVDIAIARATYDRSNDRVAHVLRFHAPISPRNFRNAVAAHGPPGSVCINIWTTRTPWEQSPNYDVCVSGDRSHRHLVASVSKLGPNGSVRRVGNASAQLESSKRMFVRFDPALIKRPGAYRWAAQVTTFERGCTRSGCQDFAPRRGRTVRLGLG